MAYGFNVQEAIDLATDHLVKNDYVVSSSDVIIKTIMLYGSRVYGTNNADSDYDCFVVVDSSCLIKEIEVEIGIHNVTDSNVDVSLVSTLCFSKMLEDCTVRAIESIFTPDVFTLIGYDWIAQKQTEFENNLETNRSIVLSKIRSEFSGVSSRAEVKARKKIEDKEYMTGLKSLFHSVRLLEFGIQVGQTGKISDFKSANRCWNEIVETLVPKIYTLDDQTLTSDECKVFYKKWVKTPKDGSKHLMSLFKELLPK